MAIEALTATLARNSEPEYASNASALRALVTRSAPELTPFIDGLLNRQPSLNTRFGALAASLGLPTQLSDESLFRKVNKLRGEFAHGRPHDPEGPEETTIAREANSLALRYITAHLSALKEKGVAKGFLRLAGS